jgi:DNA-binding PadR family transcriptional regulator
MHAQHICDPRWLGWALAARQGGGPGRGRHRGGPRGGFPGFGPPRGPRARRGDVRAALLLLLAEEPRNGYQLMQEIEQRSDGLWRPSPGSVYPALQQLEDEGLVTPTEAGRKAFTLTDAGRAHVEEQRSELGAPWDEVKGDAGEGVGDLMEVMRPLGMALFQLTHSGTEAQRREALEVLNETRRKLYRILAEDDAGERD